MGRYKKQIKICINFSELTMIKMEWNKTQFELDWVVIFLMGDGIGRDCRLND